MVVSVEQQVFQVIHGLVMKLAASEPEQVVVELEICYMKVGLTVYLFDILIFVVQVYNQSFVYLMEKIPFLVTGYLEVASGIVYLMEKIPFLVTGHLEVASGIVYLKTAVVGKEDEHMHHMIVVVYILLTVSVLVETISVLVLVIASGT